MLSETDSVRSMVSYSSLRQQLLGEGLQSTLEAIGNTSQVTIAALGISSSVIPTSSYDEYLVCGITNWLTVSQIPSASDIVTKSFDKLVPVGYNLADSFSSIIAQQSSISSELLTSPSFLWLSDLNVFPAKTILQQLGISNNLEENYDSLQQAYLAEMMDCHWCPYAAWAADIKLFDKISYILAHSRVNSKRREQRIDRELIAYYNENEIKRIKRDWEKSNLPVYVKKMLRHAIAAHLRGEYILTISTLSTMWEGLICSKANNIPMEKRPRQGAPKTIADFKKLTQDNNHDLIFSDYFEKCIMKQCNGIQDVIDGEPNRHGIAHSWYDKYPSKKESLNAVLFTDLIIRL